MELVKMLRCVFVLEFSHEYRPLNLIFFLVIGSTMLTSPPIQSHA